MAKNKTANGRAKNFFKSKGLIFTFLTVVLILSAFAVFLIDKENSYRPQWLEIDFFKDLLNFFGIEGFNVGLTTWALFLIIFGLAYIAFIAIFFYKSIRKKADDKSTAKYGHELQGVQLVNFNIWYSVGVLALVGCLALFTSLWFPWNEVKWETVGVENLINFALCLALIVSVVVIIPAALAIIYFALKALILLITAIASSISRGVVQSQGYQEALVATQIAAREVAIDAEKHMGRARRTLNAVKGSQGGSEVIILDSVFPSLTNIDLKWAEIEKKENEEFEAAVKKAQDNGEILPTRVTREDIKKELSGYAASAADLLVKPIKQTKSTKKTKINPKTDPKNILREFTPRFQAFLANKNNLYFEQTILRSFVAGMSASRLILLEGLSGTGKTTLPRAFLDFVGGKAHFYPVQSTWKDRTDVVGYFSELVGEYKETQLLENLYEANYTPNEFNIMVLDEMNISRVEYYFADFLSVFEYPSADWLVRLTNVKPGEVLPKFIENGMVRIPVNTWFVGTINVDDSTFTVSDKVYDRAIVIDFRELAKPFKSKAKDDPYPLTMVELYRAFEYAQTTPEYCLNTAEKNKFLKLCEVAIEAFDIRFGNRIMNQIEKFLPAYVALGGTKEEALDFMFAHKILRKVDGRFESYINDGLIKLQKYLNTAYGKSGFKETKLMIKNYRRKFN